jgi:Ran GTPase-activating protein (RanGAP) involved in mRNA processing and transport
MPGLSAKLATLLRDRHGVNLVNAIAEGRMQERLIDFHTNVCIKDRIDSGKPKNTQFRMLFKKKWLTYAVPEPPIVTEIDLADEPLDDHDDFLGLRAGLKILVYFLNEDRFVMTLNLSNCCVRHTDIPLIAAPILRSHLALTNVTLSRNSLCGIDQEGAGEYDASMFYLLMQAVKYNNRITYLDISDNVIREEGAKILASMLEQNLCLIELDVQGCDIGPKGKLAMGYALLYKPFAAKVPEPPRALTKREKREIKREKQEQSDRKIMIYKQVTKEYKQIKAKYEKQQKAIRDKQAKKDKARRRKEAAELKARERQEAFLAKQRAKDGAALAKAAAKAEAKRQRTLQQKEERKSEKQRWTLEQGNTVLALRVPDSGAEPSDLAALAADVQYWEEGTVSAIGDDGVEIEWARAEEGGDQNSTTVQPAWVLLPIKPGEEVEALFQGGEDWFKGKIDAANSDNTYDILYDDDDKESAIHRSTIRFFGEGDEDDADDENDDANDGDAEAGEEHEEEEEEEEEFSLAAQTDGLAEGEEEEEEDPTPKKKPADDSDSEDEIDRRKRLAKAVSDPGDLAGFLKNSEAIRLVELQTNIAEQERKLAESLQGHQLEYLHWDEFQITQDTQDLDLYAEGATFQDVVLLAGVLRGNSVVDTLDLSVSMVVGKFWDKTQSGDAKEHPTGFESQFDSRAIEALSECIKHSDTLSSLTLSNMRFITFEHGDHGSLLPSLHAFDTLMKSIWECANLTSLELSKNGLGGDWRAQVPSGADPMRSIATLIEKSKTLTRLDLSDNELCRSATIFEKDRGRKGTQDGFSILMQALTVSTSVVTLNLKGNLINDSGARSLSAMLRENTRVSILDLADNRIGCISEEAFGELCDVIGSSVVLSSVDFGRNFLSVHRFANYLVEAIRMNEFIIELNGQDLTMDAERQGISDILLDDIEDKEPMLLMDMQPPWFKSIRPDCLTLL